MITISGTFRRQHEHDADSSGKVHISERRWGTFSRSFSVPRGLTADQVHAKLEHGVLKLELPKVEPEEGQHRWAKIAIE